MLFRDRNSVLSAVPRKSVSSTRSGTKYTHCRGETEKPRKIFLLNRGLRDRLARKRRKKKSPLILPLLFLFPFSSGSYLATPTPKQKKGLNSPYARIKDFFVKDFSFRLEWINFPDNFFGDFSARLNLCRTQVTSWGFFLLFARISRNLSVARG